MKGICYAVWRGDYSELLALKGEITPYQIATYEKWCNTANQEVQHAARAYPDLLAFVGTYRDYKADMLGDVISGIKAYSAALKFRRKCSAGTVKRAAEAMELWGTREHGDWEVSSLSNLSPTRYREISLACDKKSWMRSLITGIEADIQANWPNIAAKVSGLEGCSKGIDAWSNEKLSNQENTLENLKSSYSAFEQLNEDASHLTSPDFSESQLSKVSTDLSSKIKGCEISITAGNEALIVQAKEKERINRQKLHQDKVRAQQEALRRVTAQQQAAEAEKLRRLQQQKQDAIDSVILE